jgi:hypothetical protein
MSRNMKTCRSLWGSAAAALLLWSAGCGSPDDPAGPSNLTGLSGEALPSSQVDTVLVRSNSGLEERQRSVIRTQEEWAGFWDAAHGNLTPAPPRTEVDLEGHVLLVAAMGTRPTGGYMIAIDAVARDGDHLEARVEERSPGMGCTVTQAITSPVTVVRVPEPRGEVRFIENEVTFNC